MVIFRFEMIVRFEMVVESPSSATGIWLIMVGVDRPFETSRATVSVVNTGLNRVIAEGRSRVHVRGSSFGTWEQTARAARNVLTRRATGSTNVLGMHVVGGLVGMSIDEVRIGLCVGGPRAKAARIGRSSRTTRH